MSTTCSNMNLGWALQGFGATSNWLKTDLERRATKLTLNSEAEVDTYKDSVSVVFEGSDRDPFDSTRAQLYFDTNKGTVQAFAMGLGGAVQWAYDKRQLLEIKLTETQRQTLAAALTTCATPKLTLPTPEQDAMRTVGVNLRKQKP